MGIVWSSWLMAMAHLPGGPEILERFDYPDIPETDPLLGAWLLVIPQGSAHPSEAKELILFAMQPEQLRLAAEQGNPPPSKSLLQDPLLMAKYPTFRHQLDSLTAARPRPRSHQWRAFETKLGSCLSELSTLSHSDEANKPDGEVHVVVQRINQFVDYLNGQSADPGPPSCVERAGDS